jgi:hypothetical protein
LRASGWRAATKSTLALVVATASERSAKADVSLSTGTPCFSHSTPNITHLQRCVSRSTQNLQIPYQTPVDRDFVCACVIWATNCSRCSGILFLIDDIIFEGPFIACGAPFLSLDRERSASAIAACVRRIHPADPCSRTECRANTVGLMLRPLARSRPMYQDKDLWPFKCPECGEEFTRSKSSWLPHGPRLRSMLDMVASSLSLRLPCRGCARTAAPGPAPLLICREELELPPPRACPLVGRVPSISITRCHSHATAACPHLHPARLSRNRRALSDAIAAPTHQRWHREAFPGVGEQFEGFPLATR